MEDLLSLNENGIFCKAGGFYIDPWRSVDKALITHAHSDHARWGMGSYLCSGEGYFVMRERLGPEAKIETIEYSKQLLINGVKVSFHPAGHILGSAQIRVEHKGEVWVASGDYKTTADDTCTQFEPVKCHTFITESTFGLPIYKWKNQKLIFDEINDWWRKNQSEGKCSLLLGYSLGKAQRLIAGLDTTIGKIYTHGAVEKINEAYRESGISLPHTTYVNYASEDTDWSQAMVVATPSAPGTAWANRFGDISTGFASGWMQIRGTRRRANYDRGFALSDHADWNELLATFKATGAERILVTHGYSEILARYLTENGYDARALETRFVGESIDNKDESISEENSEIIQ